MDEDQKKLPLPEKELPAPHDMLLNPAPPNAGLLRAPNFWEKHAPSLHPVLMVLIFSFLVADIAYFSYIALQGKKTESPPPQQTPIVTVPSRTPYPVINCPEYINEQYKFSIECPQGWLVQEYGENYDGGRTLAKIIPPNLEKVQDSMYITPEYFIVIEDSPFSESPTGNKNIEDDPDVVLDWKRITVNGITGHYYNSMNCAPLCPTRFDIPYDNGRKTLVIGKVEAENEEIENARRETGIAIENATNERYLQMISSFKFLDQETLDTSRWQTYINRDYGFSFQYPKANTKNTRNSFYNGEFQADLENSNMSIIVDILILTPSTSKTYLGQAINKTVQITNNSWDVLVSEGYCDVGVCGEPFIAYQLIKNNRRYAFIFTNTNDESKIQKNILSTFTFLDQQVCTQDLKQCPDYTWTGRTGPNCEFAPCSE